MTIAQFLLRLARFIDRGGMYEDLVPTMMAIEMVLSRERQAAEDVLEYKLDQASWIKRHRYRSPAEVP